MMVRAFRLLLALSLIVNIGASFWSRIPIVHSSEEHRLTAEDWRQLTNSRDGYALEYPWGSTAVLYEPDRILQVRPAGTAYPFVIQMHENPSALSAKDWAAWRIAENQMLASIEPPIQVLAAEEIRVGDEDGYSWMTSAGDHQHQSVFLAKGIKLYELSFATAANPNDPGSAEHYAVSRRILDSFRFGEFAADDGYTLIEPRETEAIPDLSVPIWNQLDDSWKCNQLGTCTCGNYGLCPPQPTWTTVGSDGCAITSLAMVSNYYHSDFTNPGSLNTCLTNNDGYAYSQGCGNCLVKWSNSCLPGDVSYSGVDSSQIDSDLSNGRPVVVMIPMTGYNHFVVIIGKRDDGRYSVNDPWNGVKRDIGAGSILAVRRYYGPPPGLPPTNHPPNASDLLNPHDWYVSHDGLSPTLCWRNNGDPDSDSLSFHVEVRGTVNVDSSWTTNTCWRPSSLDGHYHTYQWRVEARDSHGATRWSNQTWHFAIEDPNRPPSISFNTANGNSFPSGRIDSRERNWTFLGTADDPEGHLNRVEYHCSGDNCGYYHTHSGLSSWTYERHGLAGRNDIYFRAFDDEGKSGESRHLDLRVDLAAPQTTVSLNGESNPARWPEWFNKTHVPVEVRLHAEDGSTHRARVGVAEIRYRLDGGGWQTHYGDDVRFHVGSDGTHMVEYYAVDRVGNTEGTHSVTFKIDATDPTAPGPVTETHGALSGQWQRDWTDPDFTWLPATDGTSGMRRYHVHWKDEFHLTTTPAYDPPPVRTGSHQLDVYAEDWAGNVESGGTHFTFRYDGTPPHAPDIHNDDGVPSGVWQNQVRTADFSWPTPHDEGSGIGGYYVYWGPDEGGTSGTLTTANTFVDAAPICAEDEAETYYLRVQSEDNVGWTSEWVDYVLRYDGAPPTGTLIANYGQPVVHQTTVHLDISGQDEGSGVDQMILSNDGRNWTEWLDFADEIYWEIPDIGRRSHPIYVRLSDRAGNVSEVVSDTVYLDVNPPDPESDNYWLWDDAMPAGGAESASPSYNLRASVGQPLDSPELGSLSYTIYSGYQAGALAEPTLTPTYTTYYQVGHIVSSGGTGADTLQSADYQMYGTLGQPAEMRTISSTHYVLLTGFWGGPGTDAPPPGEPEPPGQPEPECEFYSIAINDDALFTDSPAVTLNLCGPDAVDVMLSNHRSFSGAAWQPYTTTLPWTLDVAGTSVQARLVYARFRDSTGATHGEFFDWIIYDPNAPQGEVAFDLTDLQPVMSTSEHRPSPLRVIAEETTDLYVSAMDDSSGLAEMQISLTPSYDRPYRLYLPLVARGVGQLQARPGPSLEGVPWQPYSAIVPITYLENKRLCGGRLEFDADRTTG